MAVIVSMNHDTTTTTSTTDNRHPPHWRGSWRVGSTSFEHYFDEYLCVHRDHSTLAAMNERINLLGVVRYRFLVFSPDARYLRRTVGYREEQLST